MTEHTPGPWHRDTASGLNCDVRAANGRKVALTYGLSTTKAAQYNRPAYRQECDANARLIAAAPELLDALRQAELILQRDGIQQLRGEAFTDGETDRISAAIAKAEGRPGALLDEVV